MMNKRFGYIHCTPMKTFLNSTHWRNWNKTGITIGYSHYKQSQTPKTFGTQKVLTWSFCFSSMLCPDTLSMTAATQTVVTVQMQPLKKQTSCVSIIGTVALWSLVQSVCFALHCTTLSPASSVKWSRTFYLWQRHLLKKGLALTTYAVPGWECCVVDWTHPNSKFIDKKGKRNEKRIWF